MKIAISYPPLPEQKGVPLLAQNRQFQWFKDPTYVYPMIPASAATLLKEAGFEVVWDDGIAEGLSFQAWTDRLLRERPDLVLMESKTPVIKQHWKIINTLKRTLPQTLFVLAGDHVTALPRESMLHSQVDFILTGGDYDFLLRNLCQTLIRRGERDGTASGFQAGLEPGIWYRQEGQIRSTGPFRLSHDLGALPPIDRELTAWRLYASRNGNFKYLPGTYVMAGRDCWWGRCTFCSWTTLYPAGSYRTVPVERHLDEIGALIENQGVREIFDDTGCFPRGAWLEAFCQGMITRGYHKRVRLGCNTRVRAVNTEQFQLMKQAGFRFVLIGLESVRQATLNRLRKGIRVPDIARTCRDAKNAGLEPHITTMLGYPWETREDAEKTVRFARELFRQGIIDSLQATIVVPYPGTPLFEEAREQGWLRTEDWDRYDMKESVWQSPVTNSEVLKLTQWLYRAALAPGFILRKVISVRTSEDLKFLLRASRKLLGHLSDFGKTRSLEKKA